MKFNTELLCGAEVTERVHRGGAFETVVRQCRAFAILGDHLCPVHREMLDRRALPSAPPAYIQTTLRLILENQVALLSAMLGCPRALGFVPDEADRQRLAEQIRITKEQLALADVGVICPTATSRD